MGYREPDVVLGLDVDGVGVKLPHSVVASTASVDVAADGILGHSDNAEAGVEAWQRTKDTSLLRSTLKESLAVHAAVWRALPGMDTTLGVKGWILRASKHRMLRRLGKVAMQMWFDLGKVNSRDSNFSRMDNVTFLLRRILRHILCLGVVDDIDHVELLLLLLLLHRRLVHSLRDDVVNEVLHHGAVKTSVRLHVTVVASPHQRNSNWF